MFPQPSMRKLNILELLHVFHPTHYMLFRLNRVRFEPANYVI